MKSFGRPTFFFGKVRADEEDDVEEVEEDQEESVEEQPEEEEEQEWELPAEVDTAQKLVEYFTTKVRTPGYNPHFPNTNQSKHCWSLYINYHRCVKLKGENDPECKHFQGAASSMCPTSWTDAWDEARESDRFATPYADSGSDE
ncbi:Cytochrome c oxidase subunit 6B [Balamuthia mandrillaris]